MENIANLKFEMKFLQVYGEHNTICFAKQVSFTVQIIIWNQAKKKVRTLHSTNGASNQQN